jgi:MFS family permease
MRHSVLQLPNFRWLWLGQTFIFSASQFWFVALTWLVLQKTGSGFAIGTVLMAAAVPRGLFMLIGGAISDRLPTNIVAAFAAITNAMLIGIILAMLFLDIFRLNLIVAIAVLFGLLEAFLYPAILALLPQFVSKSRLAEANAWMQGSEQITNVLGPATAGIAIGALGLPTAFAINTILMAIGGGCICLIRTRPRSTAVVQPPAVSLVGEIHEGLQYAWQRPAIRISLLMIAMINFAILGPIVIGVADMVSVRFGGNATTFGYLQSAYGIGALLGVLIASRLSGIKNLKPLLVFLSYSLGTGLILLGFVQQAWIAAGVIALMGIGGGIVGVLGLTWLQQQTATSIQGRMMSLVMFAAIALDPFSQALSGVLLEIDLTGLFVAAGSIMFLTGFVSSLKGSGNHSIWF